MQIENKPQPIRVSTMRFNKNLRITLVEGSYSKVVFLFQIKILVQTCTMKKISSEA